ncbi:unnamed protein product [Lactuca saligna]|uniref:Bifunctional lysine-specific demethylase and histidyl-hydroxylase n=1 Tax=Lactuca saligna TaxID=75948 RepID=A0AA35ZJE9_LACSI|nr:unnamed protein product [Lactuca saligna]
MGKRRRRTSSSSTSSSPSSSSSTNTSSPCSDTMQQLDAQLLFGIMLAALSNHELGATSEGTLVIQKALDHLLLSLLSKSPNSVMQSQQTLHIPLISLLPVLLNSKCSVVACSGLETVGAASLFSIEMNEQIASDGEIVKGLITAVTSSRRSVAMAACNALLDLLTTSVGRCKLLEFSAIDNLILRFLQVPKSSSPPISLISEEVGNKTCFKIGFMEDEYPILLLDLAITLINDCTLEQLVKIPRELLKEFIKYLSRIWAKVHRHTLLDSNQESEKFLYSSSIKPNNLAETLFRLSMEEGPFATSSKFLDVKRSIFHLGQMNFESFIINHWEESPLLITESSNASSPDNNIFNSFLQLFTSKDSIPSFLASLLQNLVSTPPISSDELDIITFLKESREEIGCPIIYQQDIRILKTLDSKIENHFLQGSSNLQDIASVSNAFNNGYTFALRGMEFHFQDFASISEGLAFLFGQPSTGVNMYLTPPNSQGLARHRDDHCVLVCQIQGVKKWKVFPNFGTQLPRLYSSLDDCIDMMDGCKEYLLREGDILYIPRGFPHEACTIVDDVKANEDVKYSLHLTLAIEIEPPFEWEGFIHVALHHWYHNYKISNHKSFKHSSLNLDDVAMHLMHIAIKSIGDIDPTFRKACLVGGISYQSVTQIWLKTHQQLLFNHLISKINSNSNFKYIASNVLGKHEDILENFKWLEHLDKKTPSIEMEDIFHLLIHEKEKVEAVFMMIKSEFCNKVVLLFDDVVCCYNELLEKYRRTRKQYINGMLALNCSC